MFTGDGGCGFGFCPQLQFSALWVGRLDVSVPSAALVLSGGTRAGEQLWFSTDLSHISSRGLQWALGTFSRLTFSLSLCILFPSSTSHPVLVQIDELFPCCERRESQRVVCSLLKRWPLGPWCPFTDLHPLLWPFPTLFGTASRTLPFTIHLLTIQTNIFLLSPFQKKASPKHLQFIRSFLEAPLLCLQRSWKWLVWCTEITVF